MSALVIAACMVGGLLVGIAVGVLTPGIVRGMAAAARRFAALADAGCPDYCPECGSWDEGDAITPHDCMADDEARRRAGR